MSFYLMLSVVLIVSAMAMLMCSLVFSSAVTQGHRIHNETVRRIKGSRLYKNAAANAVLSAFIVFGVSHGFYATLFYETTAPVWRMLLEGVAILGLYDVGYYVMHRYLFHQWAVLRRVHAVHHVIRSPTALDSLYMHPLEMVMGVGLLMLCTFVVGPVSIYTFVTVFLVYSLLNIVIHAGLDLPFFPFTVIGTLAKKHDTHHVSMQAGNYSSTTPICDWIFGTAQ